MQADLIHLSTKDVCEPADLFGRLIMHRVQTLEPVRLVSMTNLRAERMTFSTVVAEAGVKSPPKYEEALDRVEAALLSHQGIEDSLAAGWPMASPRLQPEEKQHRKPGREATQRPVRSGRNRGQVT